jgi:glutathionylspermidine synthase
MDFLKDIAKTAGNEYAALVSEGVEAGDVDNFIDTGSYIFNALLSGFNLWWIACEQNYSSGGRVGHWKNILCDGYG